MLTVFRWWDCILHRSIGTAAVSSTKSCAVAAEHVPVPSNNLMVLQAHFCTLDSLLSVTNAWIMHWFSKAAGKLRLIRIGFLSSPLPRHQKHQTKLYGRYQEQKRWAEMSCSSHITPRLQYEKSQGHNKPLRESENPKEHGPLDGNASKKDVYLLFFS